jgi:hypothetical protein
VKMIAVQTKALMGDVMKEAAFSMAEVKFAMGEFSDLVLQNVGKSNVKVKSKKDNVAGTFGNSYFCSNITVSMICSNYSNTVIMYFNNAKHSHCYFSLKSKLLLFTGVIIPVFDYTYEGTDG